MKHIVPVVFFLCFFTCFAFASGEIEQLNSAVKNSYLKPEKLDGLVSSLKSKSKGDLDSLNMELLFETYRLAANCYVANNHYKQALLLYKDYLVIKEKYLAQNRSREIENQVSSNNKANNTVNVNIANLRSEITELESNASLLKSRNLGFIRNAALIIILFSAIFTMLFFRLSWKLKSLKQIVSQLNNKILAEEKVALLGRFKDPVIANSTRQLEQTKQEIVLLNALFIQTDLDVIKDQTTKIKKMKDSFAKAQGDIELLAKNN